MYYLINLSSSITISSLSLDIADGYSFPSKSWIDDIDVCAQLVSSCSVKVFIAPLSQGYGIWPILVFANIFPPFAYFCSLNSQTELEISQILDKSSFISGV